MSKPILLTDCDCVLNNFSKHWMNYLKSHYSLKHEYRFVLPNPLPYDLTKLFITTEERTGYEYFDYIALYDNMEPRDDAVEYIPALSKHYEIICATHTCGPHMNSKVKWIKKWFPQIEGIYCTTTDKSHLKADVFLDDSVKNLNQMYTRYPDTDILRFRQDYKEDVSPIKHYKIVYNWTQIYELLVGNR